MKRSRFSNVIAAVVLAILVACGGTDTREHRGSVTTALSAPGLTPLPMVPASDDPNRKVSAWKGSPVELLYADALASCAYEEAGNYFSYSTIDQYYNHIFGLMEGVTCPAHPNPQNPNEILDYGSRYDITIETRWLLQRNDRFCNIDPSTGATASAGLERLLPQIDNTNFHVESPFGGDAGATTARIARRALQVPVTNLCIAQHLRSKSPGISAGEALLLSAADQRQLLALTKERSQMAMLQFGLLGQLFATPTPSTTPPPESISNVPGGNANNFLPMLRHWIQQPSSDAAGILVAELAEEFATAVQLHSTASQEFAQLLSRSGAARLPRGASSSDPSWTAAGFRPKAVETWGPGSWRQRTLASLYGGDPLVEDEDHTTPWQHFADRTAPGGSSPVAVSGGVFFDNGSVGWPLLEFVSTELKDPKVAELFALAKGADTVDLRMDFGTTTSGYRPCENVLRPPTVDRLYRATEAYVRANGCNGDRDPDTGVCQNPPRVSDVTESTADYTKFDLWKRYRITPDHATQLVAWLDEIIPKSCGYNEPNARGALDFAGAIEERQSNGEFYYHLSNFDLRQRTLRETAALFSNNSAFWLPRSIDITAEPVTQGFQGLERAQAFALSSLDEEARLMGAVPALMAVRESLIFATTSLGGLPVGIKNAVTPYFSRRQRILDVIDGAIGRSGVRMEPVTDVVERSEERFGVPFVSYYMQQHLTGPISASDNEARWTVDINVDPHETFWDASLFWSASAPPYLLVALANEPLAWGLAANPGSAAFGKTIADTLGSPSPLARLSVPVGVCAVLADGTSDCSQGATSLGLDAVRSWRWSFQVDLPLTWAPSWTFVVQRHVANDRTYSPLVSHVANGLSLISATSAHPAYSFGPGRGQYLSFNGSLSNFAANVMAVDLSNPAKPAFDGFGLPNKWLPPSDPALFGGTAGDDAVAAYLRKARESAEEATAAVKEAFEAMLKQEQDGAELSAAISKSQKVAELERSALCGDNPKCDTSIISTSISVPDIWDQAPRTRSDSLRDPDGSLRVLPVGRSLFSVVRGMCKPTLPGQTDADRLYVLRGAERLDCLATGILAGALIDLSTDSPVSFPVLRRVAEQQHAPALPSFAEYSGGTLQAVAIEQWTAIRALEDRSRALIAATDAAIGNVSLLTHELENAQGQAAEMRKRCEHLEQEIRGAACQFTSTKPLDGAGLTNYNYSCQPPSFDQLEWLDEESVTVGSSKGKGIQTPIGTFGPAESDSSSNTKMSLGAKRRLCESYRTSVDSATWRLMASVLESYAGIEERTHEFTEGTARLRTAAAQGLTLRHQTELAIAKNNLAVDELRASQVSSFRLYGQLHSYDGWRAKSLLEAARLAAAVARKAIESRYVVNLSDLTAPEPLVASPSMWADQIYEYDLDMPAAVGLTVGEAVPTGIYPNRMLDYVGNLERFVNGFSIARPTAVAHDDTELISLPGPRGVDEPLVEKLSVTSGLVYKNLADGRSPAWSYFCPDLITSTCSQASDCEAGRCGADQKCHSGDRWVSIPVTLTPSAACGAAPARPARASVLFGLDPWGRLHGDIADEPFERRYNARWLRLGVNIVGTGVLDCSKAIDSARCYTQPFIRYRMMHSGAPWITDAEQSWSFLPLPTGQIEGAKALAAEQWLDPIVNSWTKPFVAAISRSEFTSRPFGGAYEIQFEIAPEVVLERIERVQVLTSSDYWVAQR
jgi:hypothetical protein